MRTKRFGSISIFICAILLTSLSGNTAGLGSIKNARTYPIYSESLVAKSLAYACLGILRMPGGLPCNPSMLPLTEKNKFFVEGQISNGASQIQNIRSLLENNIDEGLIDDLFGGNNTLQIDSSLKMEFLSPYLAGRFMPVAYRAYSVIRNESNPEVELLVVEESDFMFQSGYRLYKNLLVGAQLRIISREFIDKTFLMTSLSTDAGKNALKPIEENLILIEPGLTWFVGPIWAGRFSLMVKNLGYIDSDSDQELDTPIDFQIGYSVSPPVPIGELQLSIERRRLSFLEDELEAIRFGALYNFGALSVATGIDSAGSSLGFYYELGGLSAGISYSTTDFPRPSEDGSAQTMYAMLGWQL